jgi:hypothetical protein
VAQIGFDTMKWVDLLIEESINPPLIDLDD